MPINYIKIGQILKPLGTSGELKIDVQDDFFDDIADSDHIFVKVNGHNVPYFIENLRETNHLLLKLEDIDNPESASSFTLKDLYLREKDISSKKYAEQVTKEGWIGYTIFDKETLVGEVLDIEIFPSQIMASVKHDKKNILIPLVDDLIVNIDETKRKITMDLPEGLLNI